MNILITGGRGFVGGFLADRLLYNILTPSREELDLQNKAQVDAYFDNNEIDVVIHCALTGRNNLFSEDPHYTTDSLWMFRNLWNNRHKYNKLINLGTAYEFDLSKDNHLVKEHDVVHHLPNTSYGLAKNLIARTIQTTDNFYNLRLFGVFHETESDQRFFQKLYTNKTIDISNDIFLDYIYLEDIIPVINKIINNGIEHRDINMVYEQKYRLSHMARMFCTMHNIDINNVKVKGISSQDLTGDSSILTSCNFNLIGLVAGLASYKF